MVATNPFGELERLSQVHAPTDDNHVLMGIRRERNRRRGQAGDNVRAITQRRAKAAAGRVVDFAQDSHCGLDAHFATLTGTNLPLYVTPVSTFVTDVSESRPRYSWLVCEARMSCSDC